MTIVSIHEYLHRIISGDVVSMQRYVAGAKIQLSCIVSCVVVTCHHFPHGSIIVLHHCKAGDVVVTDRHYAGTVVVFKGYSAGCVEINYCHDSRIVVVLHS